MLSQSFTGVKSSSNEFHRGFANSLPVIAHSRHWRSVDPCIIVNFTNTPHGIPIHACLRSAITFSWCCCSRFVSLPLLPPCKRSLLSRFNSSFHFFFVRHLVNTPLQMIHYVDVTERFLSVLEVCNNSQSNLCDVDLNKWTTLHFYKVFTNKARQFTPLRVRISYTKAYHLRWSQPNQMCSIHYYVPPVGSAASGWISLPEKIFAL